MSNYIPKYLVAKNSTIWFVCGTALFAELFILIYQPFGSRAWAPSDWVYIGYATLVVLTAMAIIAVSRTIMYYYGKKHDIAYWQYGVWIAAELLAMALVYSLFPLVVLHKEQNFFALFREASIDTIFIVLIPYTVATLAFILRDKNEQLRQKENEESVKIKDDDSVVVNFRDEKGELKLSLRASSLYYIESADNYVTIHYMNMGKLSKYMLRNTLKQIEEEIGGQNMVRCHRSYIVNLDRVKLLSRGKNGLELDFGIEGLKLLPVSKTYSKQVIENFN